jgi:hypothetical protein
MRLPMIVFLCILIPACKSSENSTIKHEGGAEFGSLSDIGIEDSPWVLDLGQSDGPADAGPIDARNKERARDAFLLADGLPASTTWAVQAVSSAYDTAKLTRIAVDTAGNTYIAGSLAGSSTFGSITATSAGAQDAFVAKLDKSGTFLWVTLAKGTSTKKTDTASDIVLDGSGGVYVTGQFSKTATFGSTVLSTASKTWGDLFVAKLDASSGTFQWALASVSNSAGGARGGAIGLDGSGDIYLGSELFGKVTLGSTTVDATASANQVLGVSRLSSAGAFKWTSYQSGSGGQKVNGLAVSGAGTSTITGESSGSSIFGSKTLAADSSGDVFVVQLDSSGTFLWASGGGGTMADAGNGVRMDSSGNSYVTGSFQDSATFGTASLKAGLANQDHFFLAKLDPSGSFLWATTTADSGGHHGNDLVIDGAGGILVTGSYFTELALGSSSLKAPSSKDVFVVKADSKGSFLWGVSTSGTPTSFLEGQALALSSAGDLVVGGNIVSGSGYFGSQLLKATYAFNLFVWKLALSPGPTGG